MSPSIPAAAGLLLLASLPALAGGSGCAGAECYREAYSPPVYKTVAERYMVQAPRTYAMVTPAEYGVVHEKVMVEPPSRRWSVTVDAYGRKVGCWVTTPARYASVARRVMVRPAETVPYAVPAQYGVRHHTVMVAPPQKTWEPVGRGYGYGGGYGAASGGFGYGSGYARPASYGGGGLVGAGLGLAGGAASAGLGLAGAGLGVAGGALGLDGDY